MRGTVGDVREGSCSGWLRPSGSMLVGAVGAALGCEPAAPAYDLTGPRVISVTPAPGTVGVDPGAPIEVRFDEPVGPLDAAHVVLVRADAVTPALKADLDSGGLGARALDDAVSSTLASLDGGRGVRVEHPPLDRGATYALLLSADLADSTGNVLAGADGNPGGFEAHFETAPPGPAGTLVVPDPAAGLVPPNLPEVAVVFDRELGGLPPGGLQVEDAGGRPVPGESFLSVDRRRIRRTLDERLRPGERHAVVLGAVVDPEGVPATGGPWGFDVAPCTDERAPRLLGAEVATLDFTATLTVRTDEPASGSVRLRVLGDCAGAPAALTAAASCEGTVDPCSEPPAPGGCTARIEVRALCPETLYEATPVLVDPAGHETTGAPLAFRTLAPAARPTLTEVLADAAAPEERGEFIELVNDSPEPWDPAGWTLVKVTASSEVARSLVRRDGGTGPLPGRATLVYATRTFEPERYGGLPAGAILLEAATQNPERSVFGTGLSSSDPPGLELRGPGGVVLSAWPAGVRCPEGKSAARAPGTTGAPACGEATPGR